MFYLIRLDFRPGGASPAEVRELWRRSAAAVREPGGSGTVRGFKVVGQQTIFALAEFADNGAVDDALARLSNVEGLGDAAEVEFMAVRTYDEPGDAATEPAEEPAAAASGLAAGAAPPEGPALAQAGAATEHREDERSAYEVLVPPERGTPPEPPKDASVAEAIRSLAKEPVPPGPEEQRPGPSGPARHEAGRQPEGSVTDTIRSLATPPGRPPDGPAAEDHGPTGQNLPSQEPVAARPAPPEPEPPADPSATGMIRGLHSPGRVPASEEGETRTGAGEERVPAAPPERDAGEDRPAQPGPPPGHSAHPSITGLIRSLVAPSGATGEPAGPAQAGEGGPAGPARHEAGRQPEGPASDPRRGPEAAPPEAAPPDLGQDQETAIGPAAPEGSITAMIRTLDAPGLASPGSERTGSAATSSGPRVLLRPAGGPGGDVLEVGQAGATMGRSLDNAIQISDGRLSRRHAKIEFRDGAFWLTDLGSSNGTFVNGARLEAPHRLRTGDAITLGATRLDVTLEGTAS